MEAQGVTPRKRDWGVAVHVEYWSQELGCRSAAVPHRRPGVIERDEIVTDHPRLVLKFRVNLVVRIANMILLIEIRAVWP